MQRIHHSEATFRAAFSERCAFAEKDDVAFRELMVGNARLQRIGVHRRFVVSRPSRQRRLVGYLHLDVDHLAVGFCDDVEADVPARQLWLDRFLRLDVRDLR